MHLDILSKHHPPLKPNYPVWYESQEMILVPGSIVISTIAQAL